MVPMASFDVLTWNVLHHTHALNWGEEPVKVFPVERERNVAIAARVARWLRDGVSVVCLQEVSGDQLARLADALGDDATLFSHRHARVPRLRVEGASPLEDPGELLVTAVRGPSAGPGACEGASFAEDPGKGFLAVEVKGGLLVINTHVSYGPRRGEQLAALARLIRKKGGTSVLMGDFNAPSAVVCEVLGDGIRLATLDGARPTRRAIGDHPGSVIDHILTLGGDAVSAELADGGDLSDHEPVLGHLLVPDACAF